MKSQEYFFYLSSQKSTNKIVKSNILTSGLFVSQKILKVVGSFNKITAKYKPSSQINNVSERTLGPGRYPTPPPPQGQSFYFNKSPRFEKSTLVSPISITKNNSSFSRSANIQVASSRSKKIGIAVNKEAKKILEQEKREKLIRSLKEKVERAEYRKNSMTKDLVCIKFCSLLMNFTWITIVHKKCLKIMKRKEASRVTLFKLVTLCKAFGKFLMAVKNFRKKKAILRIKFLIPVKLKYWLTKHKKRLRKILSTSFQSYLMINVMRMFKKQLFDACSVLQRKIRNYLTVLAARKQALDLFWLKLNRYKILAPAHIRQYFISRYLKDKMKSFYYENYKDKKIFLLIDEKKHQEFFYEITHLQGRPKRILRLFVVNDMVELIGLANASASNWEYMNLPVLSPKKSKSKRKAKKKLTVRSNVGNFKDKKKK